MPFFRYLLLLLCLGLLAASGCVRQPIDAAGLEVLRQGQLEEPEGDVDIAPVVYVNVRDNTNRVFGLRAQTESWLRRQGYTIVPNPSEAGYILQIVVLSAGIASVDNARQIVAAGYDAPAQLSGKGASAMVADILLVQRRIPKAQRPSNQKLKSIGKRNAVGNSQMRIALLVHQELRLNGGLPPIFAETMGKELAASVHATGAEEPAQQNAKGNKQ